MTTYKTTRPNGRLTKTEERVGRFRVQTFKSFGHICFRIIDLNGEQVEAVLEGTDPEFEEAVDAGLEMMNEETIQMIQNWNKKSAHAAEDSK